MNTNRPPIKPEERRVWIKAMLALRGSSFAAIARELGVTRGAVRHVQDRPYPKMEQAIAEKLGFAPKDIWPERYTA